MEEEMIRLCNIMPVELAIQRELEYRKKMQALNEQRQNDFKPLLIGQVSPASESETLIDRKRKVQAFNAQSSRSRSRFICVICQVAFATVFHLKMHGETSAHRTRVCLSKKHGENISNPFLCELCNCSCSTGRVMEFHVAGLRHAECLQEFEDAKRARIRMNLASI